MTHLAEFILLEVLQGMNSCTTNYFRVLDRHVREDNLRETPADKSSFISESNQWYLVPLFSLSRAPKVLSTVTNRFNPRETHNKKIEAWRRVDDVKKSSQKDLTAFELEFWSKVGPS